EVQTHSASAVQVYHSRALRGYLSLVRPIEVGSLPRYKGKFSCQQHSLCPSQTPDIAPPLRSHEDVCRLSELQSVPESKLPN
ncbi:hypothetical protein C0J52_19123, partial [Blattella germanica]